MHVSVHAGARAFARGCARIWLCIFHGTAYVRTYVPWVTDVRNYTRSIFIFHVVFASRRLCDSVEASWRMMRVAPVEMLPAVLPAKDARAAGGETSAASLRTARQSPASASRRTLSNGRGGDRVRMRFLIWNLMRAPFGSRSGAKIIAHA